MKKVTLVLATVAVLAFSGFASATSYYLFGYQVVATKSGTSDPRPVPLLQTINILFNTETKCEAAKTAMTLTTQQKNEAINQHTKTLEETSKVEYLNGSSKGAFDHTSDPFGPPAFIQVDCYLK